MLSDIVYSSRSQTAAIDEFTQVFRQEHREVRDLLLDLIPAFQAQDHARIQHGLGAVATPGAMMTTRTVAGEGSSLPAAPRAAILARLLQEHEQFRRMLAALERALGDRAAGAGGALMGDADGAHAAILAQALARLLAPHVHQEEHLAGALERTLGRASPTGALRLEHEHVETLLRDLTAALATRTPAGIRTAAVCVHQLGQLLPDHMEQEEGVVFRLAGRHLRPVDWAAIAPDTG